MIKLENVNKKFDGRVVLENFNLKIEKGEFISIVGSSGSGKTTVLHLIGLLLKPDSGKVIVTNAVNPSEKQTRELRRHTLGYIFQNYVLMDNETVGENLLISKKYNPDYNDVLVKEVLITVGMDESFLKKKVYQLSGGEQQRIAIARAMLKKSEIILADEPTGNLDAENKKIIIELFKKLKEMGKTIVCVTHDDEMAKQTDRIVIIEKNV